jgi:hypothetical protein
MTGQARKQPNPTVVENSQIPPKSSTNAKKPGYWGHKEKEGRHYGVIRGASRLGCLGMPGRKQKIMREGNSYLPVRVEAYAHFNPVLAGQK